MSSATVDNPFGPDHSLLGQTLTVNILSDGAAPVPVYQRSLSVLENSKAPITSEILKWQDSSLQDSLVVFKVTIYDQYIQHY